MLEWGKRMYLLKAYDDELAFEVELEGRVRR